MARRSSEAVDGRVGRLMRSRLAICEACLDLVEDGVLRPTADQIAERAGLSRRSIFHHFGDLAELYQAVVDAGLQRCAPLRKQVPREAPLAERIATLSEVRAKFLEATSPYARALTAQALLGPASEEAREVSRESLHHQRDEIEALFADVLAGLPAAPRAELVEALAAAVSPPTWEYLRHGRALSMPRARAVMERMLAALLGGGAHACGSETGATPGSGRAALR